MKNSLAAVLIVAMLATSVLMILDFLALQTGGEALIAAGPGVATRADRARIVQSFYDAANADSAGPTSWTLAAVVSPGVEVHLPSGRIARGLGALREQLNDVSQDGEIMLDPARLIDDGAEVAAMIEGRAPARTDDMGESDRSSLLWRTVDLFHIEQGMITGYWPGSPGEPPAASIPAVAVPVTPGDVGVSLTRLELGTGAAAVSLHAALPHLFLVESGSFTATGNKGVYVAFAGEQRVSRLEPKAGAAQFALHPDDVLFMPDGDGPTIRAAAGPVGVGLSLLIGPQTRIDNQVSPLPRDVVTVMGMHDATRVGVPFTWENGALTETLAVAMLPAAAAPTNRLEIASVPLQILPGQRETRLPPGVFRLAIVRSGSISASGRIDQATSGSTPSPAVSEPTEAKIGNGTDRDETTSYRRLYATGEAFVIQPGDDLLLGSDGKMAADLLLIEVSTPSVR
ncbi:MAG: nuclear transport factor 2 family protein [Thermomicrobiales bacterium]